MEVKIILGRNIMSKDKDWKEYYGVKIIMEGNEGMGGIKR